MFKLDHVGRLYYALECERLRKGLGMLHVDSVLHPMVKLTRDYSDIYPPRAAKTGPLHLNGLRGKASVLKSLKFNGISLANALRHENFYVDWLSVAEVLLFRRAVRSTDTNSCNMMISAEDGKALSVDENRPETAMTKVVHGVRAAVQRNSDKIAAFLGELRKMTL